MADKNILINSYHQLKDIKIWPLPLFRPQTSIKIISRDIPPERQKTWEEQLNQRVTDCGCELAGMGFIAGVVVYLFWIIFGPVRLINLSLNHLWQGLIVAIIGVTIGKILGLLRAQMRLVEVVKNIQEEWQDDADSSENVLPSPAIEK